MRDKTDIKDNNTLYWVWLSEKCGVASKQFRRLMDKYDNPFDIYRLDVDETEHIEGINERLKAELCDKSLENSYSIMRYCKTNKVDIVTYGDPRYPSRLKEIEDPPVLLYCLGRFPDMNTRLCVGMVGTRRMSEYGRQSAYKIAYELAAAGAVVVSGMALGVDGVSACGAIAAGGRTVAVLGCGISVVYPKEHARLMKEIAKDGAVITEYPPFERPYGGNFPKRNRLISGLSQGVLVIEGAVGSGSLITAAKAVSQGRELFALPGKIDESNSAGPNELIKNGANVVLSADDIIANYEFLYGDVIDHGALTRAKRHSELSERELKRLGVSAVYYKGGFDAADDTAPINGKAESETYTAERATEAVKHTEIQVNKNTDGTDESTVKADEGNDRDAMIARLDDKTRIVWDALPKEEKFTADHPDLSKITVAELMTALTMLEISGLVESLPGGAYVCK